MTKKFKETNQETYNIISKDWNIKRDYFWEPVVNFAKSFKNPDELKYLDLGCGSGRNLELAIKYGFSNENLLGCDFSSDLLKIVSNKGFNTNLSDLENLKIEDNSFDVIICIAVHHHLLEREQQLNSLKEMRRVLKNDGKLLICNWFPTKEYIKKAKEKGKFIYLQENIVNVYYVFENKKYDRFYYLFEENEFKELCMKAGFKIEKEEYNRGNFYLTLSQ